MGVDKQLFYLDCPESKLDTSWLDFIGTKILSLQQQGFISIWLPLSCKNFPLKSKRNILYNYYYFGKYYQISSIVMYLFISIKGILVLFD